MIRAVALVAVLAMSAGACSGDDSTPTAPDSAAAAASSTSEVVPTSPPTVAVTTTAAATTQVPTTQAPTTVAATTTTVKTTGSKQAADCVPPLLFRDIDGDGFGVCFRDENAPDPPPGENIVTMPGSVDIDSRAVDARNIVATVQVDQCSGNGTAGTVVIEGRLTNNGSAIKRGTINLHLVDSGKVEAVVAARVAEVATGAQVALDFESNAAGSAAASVGDIDLCYLDSVQDITFFTAI